MAPTEIRLSPPVQRYVAQFARHRTPDGIALLDTTAGRVALTRDNPMLFAILYMNKYLANEQTGFEVTFSRAQVEWYELMKEWALPKDVQGRGRHAIIAPRNSGKSKTWFTIACMWAAAHGHARFISAFGDTADTAEAHLAAFRVGIDTYPLLRKDFPELCSPMRSTKGQQVANTKDRVVCSNGFVFSAKGIGTAVLGQGFEERRPDLILLDDIEKGEADYSPYQVDQRRKTVTQSILELNAFAPVLWVGTVTMAGSLVHDLAKTCYSTEEPAKWIASTGFKAHYYPAVIPTDDGGERSYWPERFPLSGWSPAVRKSRQFQINYMNKPMAEDGIYWEPGGFVTEPCNPAGMRSIISLDPAVTKLKQSDWSGLAVLSFDRATGRMSVREALQVRLSSSDLRDKVSGLLTRYPEVQKLLVETNQGGDLWRDLFMLLPVDYVEKKNTASKEARARWLHLGYERGLITHAKPLPTLEDQMLGFPRAPHDDMVDAVSTGWQFFVPPVKGEDTAARPARVVPYV